MAVSTVFRALRLGEVASSLSACISVTSLRTYASFHFITSLFLKCLCLLLFSENFLVNLIQFKKFSSRFSVRCYDSMYVFVTFSQLRDFTFCSRIHRQWQTSLIFRRSFRSKAAMDALIQASEEKIPNLVLYNYPSFSGAFAALFAHLYHSHLNVPFLVLPFSSVEPLRVEDLKLEGLETCYLLDFIGPDGFAVKLSQQSPRVIVFDHRKSIMARIPEVNLRPENLILHLNSNKSSSRSVLDYFTSKLAETISYKEGEGLVDQEHTDRLEAVLKYIEDGDLRRWALPDIKAFNIGLKEERSKLNCVTNPYVFEQLLEIKATDLIARGNYYISSRKEAAKKLLGKAFKIRLGKGLYGECMGIRADGNSHLSNEIGEELSVRSAAIGLRPIGAVVHMQHRNLKMCLRSTDSATDTSEIAKAYGGGGSSASSSFIIRMDEYNKWISAN